MTDPNDVSGRAPGNAQPHGEPGLQRGAPVLDPDLALFAGPDELQQRRPRHVLGEAMGAWLPAAGGPYRWEPRLGGLRKPRADSPNVALRHSGFRAYADHMAEPAFAIALDAVLDEARHETTTVMCAESLWWKCHRRLIADFAVLV